MTFLNQSLLFGAAAFLIPLVIHILNRSRLRTIEWGAMHLLDSVLKVNHQRFRFDQLILLLLRCTIPVLLACCLARPVLTGSRMLAGDSPTSLVVLLDNSYSMETKEQNSSRFELARTAATEIIGTVSRGSDVAVILTGGKPTPLFDQPVFDPKVVITRLEKEQAGYGASDMPRALETALLTLSEMSHPRRELIVISDFQPDDWSRANTNIAESIRQQVNALEIKPFVSLLQVGTPAIENLSVDSLEYSQRPLGVGQRLDLRANFRNHGSTQIESARVVLQIDGVEESVTQLALKGDGVTQAFFPYSFKTPGSHVVEVEVMTDDPLSADNRLAAALTIWDRLDVLLVDAAPSSQPLQSETDFLSIALTPFTFGRVSLADLVQTQTIQPKQLTSENLEKIRVVVLANVPRLSDQQLAALTDYVDQGGSLFICPGNKIDQQWYRDMLFQNGDGLLPCAYQQLQGQIQDQTSRTRIVAQHYEHPALQFFNDSNQENLSTAEIRSWYLIKEDPPSETSRNTNEDAPAVRPKAVVMARLETGDPFLVEREFGEGAVLQLATACDADWSDLPMRTVYVPLMQQLITNMAARIAPPQNIETGESAVAILPDAKKSETLSMVTPNGLCRVVQTKSDDSFQVARFSETQRPGVYTLSLPDRDAIHFVARTSRAESALPLLNKEMMSELSEGLGAGLIDSVAGYLVQDRLRRHGREIWKSLLALLLVLMFLELVLQQRFARVRV